jgi:hypothetical protein
MTAMTIAADTGGRTFRIYRQKTQVTCGPACCLILWANVYGRDPAADEGGVITLSKLFPKPWSMTTGAEINNLGRVLANMAVRNTVTTCANDHDLRRDLHRKVKPNKPAIAFVAWEETSGRVIGHFVVIGAADGIADKYTVLDPYYGLQEIGGMPFYYPYTTEPDPPSLKFTGAILTVD